MAKSGLIDLRSKSAATGDVAGRPRVAINLTAQPRYQKTHSTTMEDALSPSNGSGKIIRLHPRAVASRQKPTLPIWDKDGEYNVIRFSQVAPVKSALQRGGKTAKSQSKLLPGANNWNAGDYNHPMLENTLAAAVLIVLVISGQWILSTLLATFRRKNRH
jgi:hypothetical protein